MATPVKHYFVINQQGLSARRNGPFSSKEDAQEWINAHYRQWPCWIVPAEYAGVADYIPWKKPE